MRSEESLPPQPASRKRKRSKKARGRQRSVPQRTCIGCRAVFPKRTLMRVVRMPDDAVEIDPSGKRPGRGAYLCQRRSCWQTALKRRSLEGALKMTLDDNTMESLVSFAQTLPEESEIPVPDARAENG